MYKQLISTKCKAKASHTNILHKELQEHISIGIYIGAEAYKHPDYSCYHRTRDKPTFLQVC